jgi:hypothetical protein
MAQIPQGKKIYKEYSTSVPKDFFRIGRNIWTLQENALTSFTYYDYTPSYDITESEYLFEDFDKDLYPAKVNKIIPRKNVPLKFKKEKTLDSKSGLFLNLKLVGNSVKKWDPVSRTMVNFFTPSDNNVKCSNLQLEKDNSYTLTIVYESVLDYLGNGIGTVDYFYPKKIYKISDMGIISVFYDELDMTGNGYAEDDKYVQKSAPIFVRSCTVGDKIYFLSYTLDPPGPPAPSKSQIQRISELETKVEDIQRQISTGNISELPVEEDSINAEPGKLRFLVVDLSISSSKLPIFISSTIIENKLLNISNMLFDDSTSNIVYAINELTSVKLEKQPTLKGSKTNFIQINPSNNNVSVFDFIEHFDASYLELIELPEENIFNFKIICKQEQEDFINSKYVYKMSNGLLNHKPFIMNESLGKVFNFTTDEENIYVFYHNDELELNMLIYNIESEIISDFLNITEAVINGFTVRLFEPQSEFIYADKAIFTCALWNEQIHTETHDHLMKLDLTIPGNYNFEIHTPLHGRQLAKRKLCNGKNGNLYISNWNTADVLKVSTLVPNTYLALRIDYTPDLIKFDERADKILVHTDKDKIVSINRQTDETTVILNTMGICTALSDLTSDNAYWFVSEDFCTKMNIDKTTMLRTKKKVKKPIDPSVNSSLSISYEDKLGTTSSEDKAKVSVNVPVPSNDSKLNAALGFKQEELKEFEIEYEEVDYSFTLNASWLKEVTKFLVIPEHTIINHNNGQPLLIHEYILALTNGALMLFRNKRNYYEENYIEITGQGMVYSGNDFYTGESI